MYLTLYRRYRPQRFSDVVGQDSAVSVIRNAIAQGNPGHAYLFSGPRGCGKTSVARLIAKAVNCTSPGSDCEPCGTCDSCVSITNGDNLDIVEIDGASNNGVDEVRELKTHVALSPFSSKYKVYIIDEVHMLSIAAFNALLKTLEEPPENVIFILATTEPYKVPVTIRSRCQHIPFHRISEEVIYARLLSVAAKEGLETEDEALREIARQADGAMRDALSLMEQAVALDRKTIALENVNNLLGGASYSELEKLFPLFRSDTPSAYIGLSEIFSRGASTVKVVEGIFTIAKNLWIAANWGERYIVFLNLSGSEKEFLKKESPLWSGKQLVSIMDFCIDMMPKARAGIRTDVLAGMILRHFMTYVAPTGLVGEPFTDPERPHFQETEKRKEDSCHIENIQHEPSEEGQSHKEEPISVSHENAMEDVSGGKTQEHDVKKTDGTLVDIEEGNRSSVSAGPDWENILQTIEKENIAIFAALLLADISMDGKSLYVDFQDQSGAAFRMLSLDRNLYVLLDVVSRFTEGNLEFAVLRHKGEEKRADFSECSSDGGVYETPDEGKMEQSSLFPLTDSSTSIQGTDVPTRRPDYDDSDRQKTRPEPDRGFKEVVQEILNCTNGELMMIKSEGQQSYEEDEE